MYDNRYITLSSVTIVEHMLFRLIPGGGYAGMDDVSEVEDRLEGAFACGDCCAGDIAWGAGDACGRGERGGGEAGVIVMDGADTSLWSGSSHFKLMCVLS